MKSSIALIDEQVDKLQSLAKLNIDSSDGFRYADGKLPASAKHLSAFFTKSAAVRSDAADELNQYVSANAEDEVEEGSFLASFHRSIMAFRDMFTSDADPHAILAEAERGEDVILNAYEDAIQDDFGQEINELLRKQFVHVKSVHDEVKRLRDSTAT